MRLPNNRPVGRFLPFLAVVLAACGSAGGARPAANAAPAPVNGPAADYPVVVGAPYVAGGASYTPEDKLNYDEVGYAALDANGGSGVSGEHHTLPLPSYVEVTSLESGKTILVRLERRGPMAGTQLIGLSPAAATQLGVSAGSPVRVRRVNPPEEERALLRSGKQAPARIETPMGLVNVLRRKLPGGEGALALASSTDLTAKPPAITALSPANGGSVPVAAPKPMPHSAAAVSPPPLPPLEGAGEAKSAMHPVTASINAPGQRPFPWVASSPNAAPKVTPKQASTPPAAKPRPPKPAPAAVSVTAGEGFVVQAGAFSTRERAQGVAKAIGGSVGSAGKLYRVRTGPFGSRQEADASLAKVKAAGYSDARIYPNR